MSRAAHSANRAVLFGCGLLAAIILAAPTSASAARSAPGGGAHASVINGRNTTIDQWPWQVAITVAKRVAPRKPTSKRAFCGGSLLTPRLVITAGHCVVDLTRKQIGKIEVVSGRTRLNSNTGQVARVSGLRMPHDASGKRRYRTAMGASDWDVALLTLASPLSAKTIKLAGPDEADAWTPGRLAWITGWGITDAFTERDPVALQVARQAIMGNGLCRRFDGVAFRAARMVCIGGPQGHASTCLGDSGGPLVVATSAGYRLVGLTSYGTRFCTGNSPSVDTSVAGNQIRNWVAHASLALTGQDVIGSGGTVGPAPTWCRVPSVFGLTPAQARTRLEQAGCRLGRVRTDRWGAGRRGRIIGSARLAGWLSPPGYRLNVWVSP